MNANSLKQDLIGLDHKIQCHLESNKSRSYFQVLTVYKRPYLSDQIISLLEQSSPPSTVLIYQNENHHDLTWIARLGPRHINITSNLNWNSKFHGRFFAALMSEEDYIIVWDDDINPGREWNAYSLSVSQGTQQSIITANARILRKRQIADRIIYDEIGIESCGTRNNGSANPHLLIDYGGHSWTFHKQSLLDMASMHPPSLRNSEDAHISYASYIRNGTKTIMPKQDPDHPKRWPEQANSPKALDAFASHLIHREEKWNQERMESNHHWISVKGYTPVEDRTRD